jgi:hypothetical protein
MAHDHISVLSCELGAGSRQEDTSVKNPEPPFRSHRNGIGAGDEGCRDLVHEDHDRWYAGGYRFGRMYGKHARGRAAFSWVNGYLKNLIEAIANAKVRRMQRELELSGIRYDPLNNRWVVRKSQPAERSR